MDRPQTHWKASEGSSPGKTHHYLGSVRAIGLALMRAKTQSHIGLRPSGLESLPDVTPSEIGHEPSPGWTLEGRDNVCDVFPPDRHPPPPAVSRSPRRSRRDALPAPATSYPQPPVASKLGPDNFEGNPYHNLAQGRNSPTIRKMRCPSGWPPDPQSEGQAIRMANASAVLKAGYRSCAGVNDHVGGSGERRASGDQAVR